MKTKRFLRWNFIVLTSFTVSFHVETLMAYNPRSSEAAIPTFSKATQGRLRHAKELLGRSYSGSLVERSGRLTSVRNFVYNTVQDRLKAAAKTRKLAAGVSATILAESQKKGFDPLFVLAVIQTESKFNAGALGSHGEIGLMQIKPDTAQWIAQKENIPWKGDSSLKNPEVNVRIGVAYMSFLRSQFDGAAKKYVAAYNMGPRKLKRLVAQAVQPTDYPTRVMGYYKDIYSELMKAEKKSAPTIAQM
jgi:soluble lytic murein transglycosylase